MIESISQLIVRDRLERVGLTVNEWRGIREASGGLSSILSFPAPQEPSALFYFCDALSNVLVQSNWIIFQVDYSSNYTELEEETLNDLLERIVSNWQSARLDEYLSILFEKEGMSIDSYRKSLRDLIFFFLVFKLYAYVASSDSEPRGFVGLQDGYVFFLGNVTNEQSLFARTKHFFENNSLGKV